MTVDTALYGFVAWIGTHICYAMFILWAYLPERALQELGVTYYPNKYWAVALPCHALVSVFAIFVFHWFYHAMRVPPLESFSNLVDEYTQRRRVAGVSRHRSRGRPACLDASSRMKIAKKIATVT